MEKVKHIVDKYKSKTWQKFHGRELPAKALEIFKKADIFRSGYGSWYTEGAYYIGPSPEEATEWIIVMDDGGYYKVGAQYSFWRTTPEGMSLQCVWSYNHLKKTLRNYIDNGETIFDPGYQT